MAWEVPGFSLEEVNKAGKVLAKLEFPITSAEGLHALAVLNNWRAAHAYPLNTFQNTLRNRARNFEPSVIIAQRAKRLESIHRKLGSQPTMRMSQMQDIAGCRAVLENLENAFKLGELYKKQPFDHFLRNEKNYILDPKPDGYRSHHLVFDYTGHGETKAFSGLRVEIQIRTQFQHAWATAVEAVGIFTKQAFKFNQGNEDWLKFFALMSSAIAAIEQTPRVPGTPSNKWELVSEISELNNRLRASYLLRAYNTTLDMLGSAKDAKYFIVQLRDFDTESKDNNFDNTVTIRQYKAKESVLANRDYTELESKISDGSSEQVVLVSVDDIYALKQAYPNYFLDTAQFARILDRVLKIRLP